jgi:hypothetical protein
MSEATTQTVVETTDAQPQAGTEVKADARTEGGDLDTLLKSYDEQVKPKEPATAPEPQATSTATQVKPDPAVAELQQRFFRQDMNDLVKTVRGEVDPTMADDEFVEAWVDAQARKDPRLQQAWMQRHANPSQFEKVKAELGKGFARKFSKLPDKQVSEDREAVSAAVRGSTKPAPDDKPPNYAGMNNRSFADEVEKKHGFRPGV